LPDRDTPIYGISTRNPKEPENNERAMRSYLNVGFVEEGRMRAAIYQDGVYIDIVMMSVLKSDWQERRN